MILVHLGRRKASAAFGGWGPRRRRGTLLVLVLCLYATASPAQDHVGFKGSPAPRWTRATPDAQIALSLASAQERGGDAIARAVVIHSLDTTASAGAARDALGALASSDDPVAHEARWLLRTLVPTDILTGKRAARPAIPGLVSRFAVLGPFEDSGGGLGRAEGPESAEHRFVGADYSWGVYAVRYQATIDASVRARGVPLDLHVHPRQETCSYLSSVVEIGDTSPIVVRVAASGAFRMLWNGHPVAHSEEAHERLLLDREAVRIFAGAGQHLVTMKSCSGALADEGRVRIRVTDDRGRDVLVTSSADLASLDRVRERTKGQPLRFERVDTLLARALALGADPSTEQALVAATLLTLAGADDLRSPRAPGLLDRVAANPSTSPDQLAWAGRLSSFAANRSGWLARATDLAERAGDTDAAAFAQRALVASRLGSGLVDVARRGMSEEPMRRAADVHARWLRLLPDSYSAQSGLRKAAENALLAIVEVEGRRTPSVVWDSLAHVSTHPARALEARKRLAERHAAHRGHDYVSAFRTMGAATVEALALAVVPEQQSVVEVIRLGELLADEGRYAAAAKLLRSAADLAPNRAEAHARLARIERLVEPEQSASALAPLERAAELEPQEPELAAELAFRLGDTERAALAGDDARYLIGSEVFLERARRAPATAAHFERQLHWRRVVRFHADKRVSQLMHYAREIVVEPRTEGEREEDLPGDELLLARVHKKDGTVAMPEEQDSAGPMVRWPKLERGDVVEVAVRSWTPGPVGRRGDPPFYFVDYVGSTETRPVLYNDVILDAPVDAPLAFDVIGGKAERQSSELRGGRRITHLIWERPAIIPDEPWAPPLSELVPVVVGSAYPSWDGFLSWYRGAVDGFTTPDEQIERLAAELTEGERSREEKIGALFDFVADDIRYVNFVSGEWWLPNRPQQLLARRQGDCDDKAMLLISLLRAVGIHAKEVLVQTRMTRQRAVMRSARAAVPMFDHGIIYLPDERGGGGRFLDATSPQSRMGALPSMDAGAMALLVDDSAQIIQTPAPLAAEHGVQATWKMTLDARGGGRVEASERHAGDSAFQLRNHLAEADARVQWIEQNLIGGWFPSLEVEPEVTFDGELGGGAAKVGYAVRSRSLARHEGDDMVVALAPPMPITATLAPLTERHLPVELPPGIAPNQRVMKVTIVAPASHVFAEPPPDGTADGGSFGRAEARFELAPDKRSMTVTRTTSIEAYRIEPAEYPRWRAWLQAIDRLMLRSVRLVKRR